MRYTVLISDNIDDRAITMLKGKSELDVVYNGKLSREDTLAAVPDAHAMIIRSGTKANAELLDAAENLKVIVRAGV
ncbi:MAG: phosphoglycerate dehydrogenase, partial [Chloroflexi bacterium]|nr:phosphoglycerate dehydrogenase [Chloroflexota bacterium]